MPIKKCETLNNRANLTALIVNNSLENIRITNEMMNIDMVVSIIIPFSTQICAIVFIPYYNEIIIP